MTTNIDETTTAPEVASDREMRTKAPVLLLGSFLSQPAQVVELARAVTIGRSHVSDGDGRKRDRAVMCRDEGLSSTPRMSPSTFFEDDRHVSAAAPVESGRVRQMDAFVRYSDASHMTQPWRRCR